jgi:hypothetical protein
MICPSPYQPRFHILIITPHSFSPPHTTFIILEVEGAVNNAFFPLSTVRENYY